MSELSTNIVEMYAESKHPAKWAAMQIVKEGRPSMTCGEAMDMIERVVGEAIESATQKILPCGHPASCGEPCGWCAVIAKLKEQEELWNMPDTLRCGHPSDCWTPRGDEGGHCGWCAEVAALRSLVASMSDTGRTD